MSKKIAKFKIAKLRKVDEDFLYFLKEREFKNGYNWPGKNILLTAFIPKEHLKDIKCLSIRCDMSYSPTEEAVRIDDGTYPIYVDVGKDTMNIIGKADYIQWCNYFLFENAEHVQHIILHDIDFSGITSLDELFYRDGSLTEIDFKNIIGTEGITSVRYMFARCEKLESVDLSAFSQKGWKDVSNMFKRCESLTEIKGLCITDACRSTENMLRACRSLTSIDVSNWDMSNVENAQGMFSNCVSLEEPNCSEWNTRSLKNAAAMFRRCQSMERIDAEKWNVTNLEYADGMFRGCCSLKHIDLSQWNTASLKSIGSIFKECTDVQTINLHGWKTGKVTHMESMFEECGSLGDVDISTIHTGNVTLMSCMFSGCKSLYMLDLSGFSLKNCKNIIRMFYECENLRMIIIDKAKINSSCRIGGAIEGCKHLVFVGKELLS